MSLDKGIESGKEKRKQYRKSKRFDSTCRNHGSCKYCENNRLHNDKKRKASAEDKLKDLNND
jgi:hypothetical protein